MNVLSLFAGIGGFDLGLERAGMTVVAQCEIDHFCRSVLAKHWPEVPCYDDVRELSAARLIQDGVGPIELICGGFPCQPFSSGGGRTAFDDDRHLWPEMYRLIAECRPRWVIGENVAGFVSVGLDLVLSDLEASGYKAWAFSIPACAVDAQHRRERWWIAAHDLGNADSASTDPYAQTGGQWNPAGKPSWWPPEPAVGRVADGVSGRVDRLRSLGNAVVPQIPEMIGRAILAMEAA